MATELPISFTGEVIHGDQAGRTIGYPTANLRLPQPPSIEPATYCGICSIESQTVLHPCMIYYGQRYMFGELHNSFEVHIFDFNEDIYGQTVTVELSHLLRQNIPFRDLATLRLQLIEDEAQSRALLSSL
ncbi:MAG: riboflavin kinase [bacterium]|nr:riboflavin kinase [bacterium]